MERTRIALMGCLFSLLWASAFVAGKAALRHTDPISLLCARFAVAGALMLAWAFWMAWFLIRIGRFAFESWTAGGAWSKWSAPKAKAPAAEPPPLEPRPQESVPAKAGE